MANKIPCNFIKILWINLHLICTVVLRFKCEYLNLLDINPLRHFSTSRWCIYFSHFLLSRKRWTKSNKSVHLNWVCLNKCSVFTNLHFYRCNKKYRYMWFFAVWQTAENAWKWIKYTFFSFQNTLCAFEEAFAMWKRLPTFLLQRFWVRCEFFVWIVPTFFRNVLTFFYVCAFSHRVAAKKLQKSRTN